MSLAVDGGSGCTMTSVPSLADVKTPSKVFSMVSVRTIVPAMKATPRTTASPVSAQRSLLVQSPLTVRRTIVYRPICFMRSRTASGVGANSSSTICPSARKTTRSA